MQSFDGIIIDLYHLEIGMAWNYWRMSLKSRIKYSIIELHHLEMALMFNYWFKSLGKKIAGR